MLVLSRKKQEEIIIVTPQGEEIILKVIKINETSIKIGLEANADYQILRGELLEQCTGYNQEPALSGCCSSHHKAR